MTLPHLSREIYNTEMTKIPLLIYHLPSSMWRVHVWVYCYGLTSAQQYLLHFMSSSAGLGHQMLVRDHLDYHIVQYAHDVPLRRACSSAPCSTSGSDGAAWLPWPRPTRRLDVDRLWFSRCWKYVVFPPHQQQIITEQMEVCQEVPHCL